MIEGFGWHRWLRWITRPGEREPLGPPTPSQSRRCPEEFAHSTMGNVRCIGRRGHRHLHYGYDRDDPVAVWE